jgi:hypothetical protein
MQTHPRNDPMTRFRADEREFELLLRNRQRRERALSRVRLLGAAWATLSAITLAGGLIAFSVLLLPGLISGDPTALTVLGGIGSIALFAAAVVSVPGLLAGIGLWRLRRWARTLAVVLSVVALASVPIGTILGVLTLVVLLQDDANALFRRAANA